MKKHQNDLSNRQRMRRIALCWTAVMPLASSAGAQTFYNWSGASADFISAGNWLPAGGPPGPGDFAQFASTGGGVTVQPGLNSSTTVRQTVFGAAPVGGWILSGSGRLTTGVNGGFDPNPPNMPLGTTGIFCVAGGGQHTIDLGDGSATSLTVGGLVSSVAGAMVIGFNSRLTLTGNTVAEIDNSLINNATVTPPIALRGGTLVLDNSAGNPIGQRLSTGTSSFVMAGGGAALELRSAPTGTVFSGLTRGISVAGGSAYLRTVQGGSGTLSATFTSIGRGTARHSLFFENIGSGYIGDAGKPHIASTGVPSNFNVNQTFNGIISGSTTTGVPWTMVTNRATESSTVTGRWANYDDGIVASTPTLFTGDFAGAATDANVLFAPNAPGTVSLSASPTAISSLVFEPTVNGVTLNLGTNSLNTRGVALSGGNDMNVADGTLFYTGATGSRSLIVLNPSTCLNVSSNLADPANSSILVGGRGFVVLTGTANQINFPGAQTIYLNDGVLRVSTSNFVPTNTHMSFRGGTLEYDVSAGNTTLSFPIGSGGGAVAWNINTGGSSGENSNTDTGSGGFSAFSNTPGNMLTVNIGGAGAQLNWNQTAFVTSHSALKFGSLKSNATLIFENPLGLGTLTGQAYRMRNIHVTGGAGNAADKTMLTGAVSGVAGYDLVKTGSGVLELAATNTYQGNTIVREGELRVSGSNVGTGALVVGDSARASGTGTIAGAAIVRSGGTIRGDSGDGVGRLTTAAVWIESGGRASANLGASGNSNGIASGLVNLITGAVFELKSITGFSATTAGTWDLMTLADGANLQLNGAGVANNFVFGTFTQGSGAAGAIAVDVANLGVTLNSGDQFRLFRDGNDLALSLTLNAGPTNATWNVDADGNWSVGSNWLPGAPNAIGAVANFGSVITAPRVVTVDSPQTTAQLNFNSIHKYTIGGSNALTLDNSINSVAVNLTMGSHEISAPLVTAKDITFTITPAGSTLTVGNLQDTTSAVTKDGAGKLLVNRVRAASLAIASGNVTVLAGAAPVEPARTSVVTSLTIAAGGKLDLNNNAAVIDYATLGSLLAQTRQQIADGRLFSTLAGATTSIGYADNASLGLGSFGGQAVDSTSLLIRYTRLGDANVDGITDIGDFSVLAAAFNQIGSWQNGDFDHDGTIGIGDFSLLAANFNQSTPLVGARSVIPEPVVAAPMALLLALRRRRAAERTHFTTAST